MDTRAQTPQDFAIGVSVLLVTIIGVLAFVQGSAVGVYESPDVQRNQPIADRAATYLVENHSVEGTRNFIRYNTSGGINESLNEDSSELDNLKTNAGLDVATERRVNPRVNVTVVNASALKAGTRDPAVDSHGQRLAWGPDAAGRDNVASTTRVVKLTNATGQCDPVCWLVVRVW
ncbi:hypothetical protein BVU17_08915 [Haloarcula taiwanensis]|uniref:Uncharacterized protein n=1 Tax=Haloarcula taiwanensis TaxID=1932004 RepID=A0A2H4ZYX4_9EURY|nr:MULTISPECIES: hypothetical protein [Haloarcula]AUG47627.1 hypothetical protein BVU17_08915 [Haloarcula taiwanensis]RLM32733.1 hypothetical protein DVK01_20220 [Haloarcula sp. Atlit-120R]RLM41343.1 hypothetical protein DVK00_19810 [Haloarcula sp. Atlit-47R]RLM89448.1 hypothetical protein D3D01_19680 [Haloarcula sp. Atlit-7R]